MSRPAAAFVAAFITAFAVAFTVTACGPSHHAGSLPSPTSSAVKADETAAAAVFQSCEQKNNILTKAGRDAFGKCLGVPKANEPAFTSCLTRAATTDHPLTKAGRSRFADVDVPHCYEVNR